MRDVQTDVQTVSEIERSHPDEWVLVEILRDHNDHARKVGRVIAHSADRDDLDNAFVQFRQQHPNVHLYEFFTGELVPEGVVVVL